MREARLDMNAALAEEVATRQAHYQAVKKEQAQAEAVLAPLRKARAGKGGRKT